MGYAGGSYVFNDIARVILRLRKSEQITEEAGTEILTRVAKSLADMDWDTLDESYEEFPGNIMVVTALQSVWPEIGRDWDDE